MTYIICGPVEAGLASGEELSIDIIQCDLLPENWARRVS